VWHRRVVMGLASAGQIGGGVAIGGMPTATGEYAVGEGHEGVLMLSRLALLLL